MVTLNHLSRNALIEQYNKVNISNISITVRVATEVETVMAMWSRRCLRRSASSGVRVAQNLIALPGQQPEGTLDTLFGSLYMLFDIGALFSFMSSQLVERLHLESFLVNPPFSVTSPL